MHTYKDTIYNITRYVYVKRETLGLTLGTGLYISAIDAPS